MKTYLKHVKINHYVPVPVYRQVVNVIIQGIVTSKKGKGHFDATN